MLYVHLRCAILGKAAHLLEPSAQLAPTRARLVIDRRIDADHRFEPSALLCATGDADDSAAVPAQRQNG